LSRPKPTRVVVPTEEEEEEEEELGGEGGGGPFNIILISTIRFHKFALSFLIFAICLLCPSKLSTLF
jgi:hypothetical protein